MGIVKPV